MLATDMNQMNINKEKDYTDIIYVITTLNYQHRL